MAKAEPGRFVIIDNGRVFDAYSQAERVGEKVTKDGRLNLSQHLTFLYHWNTWGERSLYRGGVARYDPAVEEKAAPIRAQISELNRRLRELQLALESLYDYQAGPAPTAEELPY